MGLLHLILNSRRAVLVLKCFNNSSVNMLMKSICVFDKSVLQYRSCVRNCHLSKDVNLIGLVQRKCLHQLFLKAMLRMISFVESCIHLNIDLLALRHIHVHVDSLIIMNKT